MTYSFGDFTLDTEAYVLRRGGEPIGLEPKIFDVLRFLIEHRDRVVHKQELLDALWPAEFVTDSVLPRCIAAARKALGDNRSRQSWIQTAHGRGYRFVGSLRESGSATRPPADLFVGRARELAQLDALTREAIAGRGRLILLAGEPGIGKTRTADEAMQRARERGARTLEGRCVEGAGAPPFWPWVQILRGWLEGLGSDAVRAALGRRVPELFPLLPELAEHEQEREPQVEVDPAASRFQLFDAIGEGLKQSSREQPLAIVFDDLHYADAPSLELLRFLARDLHRRSLLIVATYRDVELRRTHGLAQLLGELSREPCHERIALRGLAVDEVARVLETRAPGVAAAALASDVHDMTNGNPFFVGEVASLLRDGDPDALATRLPEGIREAVGRRLDLLSQATNDALRIAAVAGREFSLGVVARASDVPRDALLAAIDEAVEYRLVERREQSPGSYRFAHALVQQTLYEEIATPLRIQLHERVGQALEALSGDGDDAPLDEIAHHYFEAAASGRTDHAVHFATRAAQRATRLFAFEESASKYEQALAALALAVDDGTSANRRCQLLLAKGDQESRAGRRDRARETFQQALQRSRETGDAELLGRAALGFGGRGEMGLGGDGRTAEFIEEALAALGEDAPGLRAQLLGRLSGAPPHTYSMSRRRELSEESLALARQSGDPGALTLALAARAWALLGPDHLDDRLRVTDELLDLAQQPGGHDTGFLGYDPSFLAHENRSLTFLSFGDMRAADRELVTLQHRADELRQPIYHWFVSFFRTSRAISVGDNARALELLAALEQSELSSVHPLAEFVRTGQRLWIASRQGDYDTVSEGLGLLYDSSLTLRNFAKSAEGMLRSVMGERKEARRCYDQVAQGGFGSLEHDEAYLVQLGFLAELAFEFDDREGAARLLELLRPYAHLNATIELLRLCDGAVAAYLGQAATTTGAYDEAEHHFDAALRLDEAMGCTASVGSVRLHWARMLTRRDRGSDRERALGLLGESEAVLVRIGNDRRLGEVRRLRAELAGEPARR